MRAVVEIRWIKKEKEVRRNQTSTSLQSFAFCYPLFASPFLSQPVSGVLSLKVKCSN